MAGKCPSHPFLKFLDLLLINYKPLPQPTVNFPGLSTFLVLLIIYLLVIKFGMNNHLNFTLILQHCLLLSPLSWLN